MRSELRFLSEACVTVFNGSSAESTANLRDMSLHGLSIQSDGFIDIEPNSPYVIAIIPEKETNIEKFQLEIRSRWVKLNKLKMESGFSILVPFNEKEFKDYLRYLAQKGKVDEPPKPPESQLTK